MAEYDLIERNKIFEKVTELYRYSKGDMHIAYRELLDYILDMPTADVQPVNRWISVDDRLPPVEDLYSNMTCICCTKNGRVLPLRYVCTIVRKKKVHRWEMMNGSLWGDDVAYWQPLPEPPKDGDTNG